jgi:hypothetical protein
MRTRLVSAAVCALLAALAVLAAGCGCGSGGGGGGSDLASFAPAKTPVYI